MGDLVNLKRFKKRALRDQAGKNAETNRALFGRTKAEKQRDELESGFAKKSLDNHRVDKGASK
ncbi:MAG: DUF4169 family protein [Rhizobiales bacterium]|nr:DUF4169 family protein [Hyphomicrobiales bacterium]